MTILRPREKLLIQSGFLNGIKMKQTVVGIYSVRRSGEHTSRIKLAKGLSSQFM